tara:strand:- start:310 stop:663 length:354 start_codon:yes stop_codon:yes gene_type:complete
MGKQMRKNPNTGKYHHDGKTFDLLEGTRAQVYHGTALKTTGGLMKKDLHMNKHGRIVSAKKHKTAKAEKRLEKAGYFTQKGKFGFVKKTSKKGRSSSPAKRGRKGKGKTSKKRAKTK